VGASEIAAGAVGVSELAALPGARVYRSAPTAIPSGQLVEVPMTDAAYSQGGVWSTAQPARLTAPVAGVYQVTGSVVFQSNGSGLRAVWIIPAGNVEAPYFGQAQTAITTPDEVTSITTSGVVRLGAGDGVALAVRQGSGTALQLLATGQQTALALQFLSP
jgi:hypothetical protein